MGGWGMQWGEGGREGGGSQTLATSRLGGLAMRQWPPPLLLHCLLLLLMTSLGTPAPFI